MTQQERLFRCDMMAVLTATIKYEELMQTLFQNLLLVERGMWRKPLCDCTEQEAKLYQMRRSWLFSHDVVNENELRKEVMHLLIRL
jgi:hypothetical protein